MERDNFILQGSAHFLKDRLMDNSDSYKCYVCEACGQIAVFNKATKTAKCRSCENSECYQIQLPYAAKLVFQSLKGMNILPRIII